MYVFVILCRFMVQNYLMKFTECSIYKIVNLFPGIIKLASLKQGNSVQQKIKTGKKIIVVELINN